MAVSKETYAEQTRRPRFKMLALLESGLSEDAALAEVFPGDTNRRRKLKTWKQKGLWPIPPEEHPALVGGQTTNDTSPTCSQSAPQEKLPEPKPTTEEEPTMAQLADLLRSPETEPLLSAIVRKVLAQEKEQEQETDIRTEPQQAEHGVTIPLEADWFPVLLPPPRMDGKKCVDPRTKLGGTVLDARLARLLEEHRRKRGVQLSRIFDTALWYYLGQPDLEGVELGEGETVVVAEEQPAVAAEEAHETETKETV